MKPSSLESKTVRPGLLAYSFYASNRRPLAPQSVKPRSKARAKHPSLVIAPLLILLAIFSFKQFSQPDPTGQTIKAAPAAIVAATNEANQCSSNAESKAVLVSITQRHAWACQGNKIAYDTPVITGMEKHPETLTPTGTYHIYAKTTDTTLTGADSTGSWKDPVDYWMPFLDNQHGTYGFHDATWRNNNEFGNVDPYSAQASHGCVELPLGASKQFYEFASVGTTVIVRS
jgi:lipoprotein-anchoring transpeptidase ErfK/SrfK